LVSHLLQMLSCGMRIGSLILWRMSSQTLSAQQTWQKNNTRKTTTAQNKTKNMKFWKELFLW
jgi:hypothetical protein